MKTNIFNPMAKHFYTVDTTEYSVAIGAAGWVDVDVSAQFEDGDIVLWAIWINGTQTAGVRKKGETSSPLLTVRDQLDTVTAMCEVAAAGLIQCYRGAVAVSLRPIGYFR